MFVCVQARHTDCVFNAVGPTIGEENFGSLAASKFNDALRCFSTLVIGMLRRNCCKFPGLVLDCGNHLGVLVSNIYVDQL